MISVGGSLMHSVWERNTENISKVFCDFTTTLQSRRSLYYSTVFICSNVYSHICCLSVLSSMEASEQPASQVIFLIFYL